MPRFFIDGTADGRAYIAGADALHIAKALRMRPGEALTLCDGKGTDFEGVLETVTDRQVTVRITVSRPSQAEPTLAVTLYQGLPKGDKMDWIVQKAVELGVNSITPVMTRRCVSRPDAKSMKKKLERYNRIALEAAKQSGRGIIPQVNPLLELDQALRQMQQSGCPILFYENATAPARQLLQSATGKIAILIGAEGGFDEDEVERAKVAGCSILSLGKRILRCETAPLAALSIIMYETGNME